MAPPTVVKEEPDDRASVSHSARVIEDDACQDDVKPKQSNDSGQFNQPGEAKSQLFTCQDDDSSDAYSTDIQEDENERREDLSKRLKAKHKKLDVKRPCRDALLLTSSDEDDEKCIICLCRFLGQTIGQPEVCNHNFCLECIEEWSKQVSACPVDRKIYSIILAKQNLDGPVVRKITVSAENQLPTTHDHIAPDDVTYCEVCGNCDREDRLLLCDGCDFGYHLECLDPPLEHVPIEDWYCPDCARVNVSNTTPQQTAVLNILAHGVSSEYSLLQRYRRRRMNTSNISELIRTRINERRRIATQNDGASTSRYGRTRISIPAPTVTSYSSRSTAPNRSASSRVIKTAKKSKTKAKSKTKSTKIRTKSKTKKRAVGTKKRKVSKRKSKGRKRRVRRTTRKTGKLSKVVSKISSTDVRLRIASRMGIREVRGTPFGLPTYKRSSSSSCKVLSRSARCADLSTAREGAGIATLSLCGTEPTHNQPVPDPDLYSAIDQYNDAGDYDAGVSSGAAIVASLVRRRISSSSAALILAKKRLLASPRSTIIRSSRPIASPAADLLGSILNAQNNLFANNSEVLSPSSMVPKTGAHLRQTPTGANNVTSGTNLVNNANNQSETNHFRAPSAGQLSSVPSSVGETHQSSSETPPSSLPSQQEVANDHHCPSNEVEFEDDVSKSTRLMKQFSKSHKKHDDHNSSDDNNNDACIDDGASYHSSPDDKSQRIIPHNTTPLPERQALTDENHTDDDGERNHCDKSSGQSSPSHASLIFDPQSPLNCDRRNSDQDLSSLLSNKQSSEKSNTDATINNGTIQEREKELHDDAQGQSQSSPLAQSQVNINSGEQGEGNMRVKRCKHGRLIPVGKEKSSKHRSRSDDHHRRRSHNDDSCDRRRPNSRSGSRDDSRIDRNRKSEQDSKDRDRERIDPAKERLELDHGTVDLDGEPKKRRRGKRGGRKRRRRRGLSRSRERSSSRDSYGRHIDRYNKYARSRSRSLSTNSPPRHRYRSNSRQRSRTRSNSKSRSPSRSRSRSILRSRFRSTSKSRWSRSRSRSRSDRRNRSKKRERRSISREHRQRSSRRLSESRNLDRRQVYNEPDRRSPRDRRNRSRSISPDDRDRRNRGIRRHHHHHHARSQSPDEDQHRISRSDHGKSIKSSSASSRPDHAGQISRRDLAERSLDVRLGLSRHQQSQHNRTDDDHGRTNHKRSPVDNSQSKHTTKEISSSSLPEHPTDQDQTTQLSEKTNRNTIVAGRLLTKSTITLNSNIRKPFLVNNDMFDSDNDDANGQTLAAKYNMRNDQLADIKPPEMSSSIEITDSVTEKLTQHKSDVPTKIDGDQSARDVKASFTQNDSMTINGAHKGDYIVAGPSRDAIQVASPSVSPAHSANDEVYDPGAPVGPISPVGSPPPNQPVGISSMLDQLQSTLTVNGRGNRMDHNTVMNTVNDLLNSWRGSNPELLELLSSVQVGNDATTRNNSVATINSVCNQLINATTRGNSQQYEAPGVLGLDQSHSPANSPPSSDGGPDLDAASPPTTSMRMGKREKLVQKLHLQERVVEAVKQAVRPYYASCSITKEEYKEVLRRAVPKICRSGEIIPKKIQVLVKGYVRSVKALRKK